MPISLVIALRNLLLHRGKSLIVGVILLIGTLIMTVGNATLSGMNQGIRQGLVDGFLGDISIMSKNQKRNDTIGGAKADGPIPLIGYPHLKTYLENDPAIARFMPYTGNLFLTILNQDRDQGLRPPFVYALGVDFERYLVMYDKSIEIVAGRFPKPGERGIVIHVNNRERFYQMSGVLLFPESDLGTTNGLPADAVSNIAKIDPTTNLIIMGLSDRNSTLDIRIPILGFYRNKKIDMMAVDLMDLESYREAMNYSTAANDVKLNASETKLLSLDDNPDSMFGNDSTSTEVKSTGALDASAILAKTGISSNAETKIHDIDQGSYELVSVRLKDSRQLNETVNRLNRDFSNKGLDARAVTWEQSAGALASLVGILKGSLGVFVFLIFFVAIIIIMNTLTMTTLERTPELGMMRAIGASKGFLTRMLLSETFLLSFVFGGIGMIVGTGLILYLDHLHLSTSNRFLQILFGGNYFQPQLKIGDYLSGIFELALVTVLSVIYPVRLARRIRPLDAISRD